MAGKIVVFDLDGTLIDTAPDLVGSLNHSLAAGGLAQADPRWLRAYLGQGGRVMIERAFRAARTALSEAELERLYRLFLDHYGTNIPGASAPYPGVPAALARLAAADFRLAICTNKTEAFAARLIEALGMGGHFAAIRGQDSYPFRKPDPRHLLATIADAGGDAGRALMVGNSATDAETAKAAGVPVVLVDFGYADGDLALFEPSALISHFDELTVELAEKLLAAAG